MKIPKSLSNLITNKYVLYLVAGLAFLNIFMFLLHENINAIIFFILIGYIMTFFSRNMIIILIVPLIITNFLITGIKFKENLDNMSSSTDTTPPSKTDKDDSKQTKSSGTHDGSVPVVPLDHHTTDNVNDESFETRQPLEYSDIKKKGKTSGTRLDHGATVEQAYDTLNKIIGGPGFTKMTEDTKRLMEQQQKLAQSMEQFGPMLDSIQPFLEKAQGLLQNVDMAGINDMINKTKQNGH
jgi:hypothetical protein